LSLLRVCMRLLVRPARSSFQHLRQVCGCSLLRKLFLKFCMYSLFCTVAKSVVISLYLLPNSSLISSSAKQQGRTVPIGLVSKLIQGNMQNLSCGIFKIYSPIRAIHQVCFRFLFDLVVVYVAQIVTASDYYHLLLDNLMHFQIQP